eukprot:378558-Rhodomonas_salina.1
MPCMHVSTCPPYTCLVPLGAYYHTTTISTTRLNLHLRVLHSVPGSTDGLVPRHDNPYNMSELVPLYYTSLSTRMHV